MAWPLLKTRMGFLTPVHLKAVIFCQPLATRFSGVRLQDSLIFSDQIPASRMVDESQISDQYQSPYIRNTDVPLAFQRPQFDFVPQFEQRLSFQTATSGLEASLDSLGRMLQYQFSDETILSARQILYHQYLKYVPRRLLPLNLNTLPKFTASEEYFIESSRSRNQVSMYEKEASAAILSTLISAMRTSRQQEATWLEEQKSEGTEDASPPLAIYFTFSDFTHIERPALKLIEIDANESDFGHWRVNTDLAAPESGVHYGRSRLDLDPQVLSNLEGLSRSFLIDPIRKSLQFHTLNSQVKLIQKRLATDFVMPEPEHPLYLQYEESPALETGFSLHLSGHANIQSFVEESQSLFEAEGRPLPVYPKSIEIQTNRVTPHLMLSHDQSFRLRFRIETDDEVWEAHGIPLGMSYILVCLQEGLGATAGRLSVGDIAHPRRGLKRERDKKVLRHLGLAQLIFLEAANFAFGLPLTDGSRTESVADLLQNLYSRLGGMILKSEGWPTQEGSLADLCSKNTLTLVEGFIQQVIKDVQGRTTCLYLPGCELRVEGLTTALVRLFHGIVADLAFETGGVSFTKARTKYFESFLSQRGAVIHEDLAVRRESTGLEPNKFPHQPGINERYLLPDILKPQHSQNLLTLIHHGFQVNFDGKTIEEVGVHEFRPEFTLIETDDLEPGEQTSEVLDPRKIDWFELHPKFFFRGQEISNEQASRFSREGMIEFQGKIYRIRQDDLPSLRRLSKFWSSIQPSRSIANKAKRRSTEDTYFQIPRSQTLDLLALRSSGVKVDGGPKWREICVFYDSLGETRPPLTLPDSFHAKLQTYQSSGVQWLHDLYRLNLGAVLADDMGLGKTVTSLAFLELLRSKEEMGSVLILVPTSLTYNWLSEATRFSPQLPITMYQSRQPEDILDFLNSNRGGAVICTYGLLQENSEFFQQIKWNCVIFDEAQNLKTITTKRTTAARKLIAGFKVCLTGTPLENHYGEFYSLFDLIVPGSLGDLAAFREKYVNPVRVLSDDLYDLKLKTKPLIMRRTKAQVMHELPPKIETTIRLPFEDQQKRIYRDIATSYNEQIRTAIAEQGESKSQLQMLTALLRLRQACSDPSAIPGIEYNQIPPKITTLIEALQDITESGESALIFTQFLPTFERIRKALKGAKISSYDICGADSRISREKKIRGFVESPGGCVLLMTLKTGGVGLNLTKASYIFHIEPWWNPAVENQATDRAHRMGQDKPVQVYRYLIRDSVEEKIESLKSIKSKRFDALLSVPENEADIDQGGNSLSQEDFEFLLS